MVRLNKLTPKSCIVLGKLILKKFSAFYVTQIFVTIYMKSRQWPDKSNSQVPIAFLRYIVYIIHPFAPRSSKWTLSFICPDQNLVCVSHLSHVCYMTRPSHPHFITIAIRGCIQKFSDWPPGARTANGTVLCH
jgi:hypothetical protein